MHPDVSVGLCCLQVRHAFYRGSGQPVLIGTCDVEDSEELARILDHEGCAQGSGLISS